MRIPRDYLARHLNRSDLCFCWSFNGCLRSHAVDVLEVGGLAWTVEVLMLLCWPYMLLKIRLGASSYLSPGWVASCPFREARFPVGVSCVEGT